MIFSRWFRNKPEPLRGAPAVRRQKSYSAQSGYVYQYYYQGQRPSGQEPGTEYVFDVSADRRTSQPVSVLVTDSAVQGWETESGRTLSATERYAIAKMALFQAFDEREAPEAMREAVQVAPDEIRAILAALELS